MVSEHRTTAQSLIRGACERYWSRPLASHDGESITYGTAWDRGGRLAAALANRGIDPGDRVGLMMANQLDYFTGVFACIRGGFVIVPMNDMLTNDEFRYMLSDSGARAVLVGVEFTSNLDTISDSLDELSVQIAIGDATEEQEPLEAVLDDETFDATVRVGDPMMLPYTGGTTGQPKGVWHSHGSIAMNLLAHITALEIRNAESMLISTPLPHSAGYIAFGGIVQGAKFTLTAGFDAERVLSLIEDRSVSWTFMVPTQIYRLLDHPLLAETDTSSLETVVYGAAPITPERLTQALDEFGPIFIQLYGQTEMPDIGTILSKSDHVIGENRVNSCGKPAAMVDLRIADPDDPEQTDPLEPGEVGEVIMRSPYTLDHYHNRPEATDETIVEGWLRTGDIARRDGDGYVYLLDRSSDMIISGGMNVYTTEVEDILDQHPAVKQVAVIGIPHEDWGEAVHAVVVPSDEGDEVDTSILRAFAAEHLADYKKPKSVEFVDDIPTTPYGKMDKKALRKPYWEESDREIN